MLRSHIFFYSAISILFLTSCFGDFSGSSMKPLAISKTNDVVIVASKDLWNGPVGDTLIYYMESPFPITPNPEPLFNLRYFTFQQIDAEPLRRQLRTYLILVDLADTSEGEYKLLKEDLGGQKFAQMQQNGNQLLFGRDKWARDQLVIYLIGKNNEDLIKNIGANFDQITEKIYSHDESQLLKATYYSSENIKLQEKVRNDFGIKIKIPSEYQQAHYGAKDKFIWMRRDSRKSIINFWVSRIQNLQGSDEKKLLLESINKFGTIVTADTKDSHLVPNNTDMPILEFKRNISGNEATEYRGIWEMTKDFMGGPYVAYLVKDKNSKDFIFFFGFTFGPGEDKKEYLQQLMAIAKTIDFKK
jgi:hypothetical protein